MTTADVTTLIAASRRGESGALEGAFAAIYDELRRLAHEKLRHAPAGDGLTTTALVHDAYLKLFAHSGLAANDRAHFLALAARAMRLVLIDAARAYHALKREGARTRVTLDETVIQVDAASAELLTLDRALERLGALDERLARVVECRYFAGLTEEETATALGVSPRTVRRDWQEARAFLYRELHGT